MDDPTMAGEAEAPVAAPAGSPASPPVAKEVVLAATTKLVELGALKSPSDQITPELLALLRFIAEQSGLKDIDLGNPQILTEFLNAIASTDPRSGQSAAPGGAAPGGAAPGGAAQGGAVPGGTPGPDGGVPGEPSSEHPLHKPGPKFIRNIPGT